MKDIKAKLKEAESAYQYKLYNKPLSFPTKIERKRYEEETLQLFNRVKELREIARRESTR